MNKETMINAVNELDDALIIAAAPLTGAAKARANRRRWTRAAVVAACLMLVCGTAAYAAGWFTKPFDVVTEGITVVDKDGNEVAGKDVRVLLNALRPQEFKGKFRDDVLAHQTDPNGGAFLVQTFKSMKEAADYLGCGKLETPYYPFEMPVDVLYTGSKDLSNGSVSIQGIGEKDGMRCGFTNMFRVNKDEAPGYLGFGLECYDGYGNFMGNPDVSEFDTANGINVKVAVFTYDGRIDVRGFLTKNSIAYNIDIGCDESDQEKAFQILHDWAEHF